MKKNGFTLIEILIVVVIIGIILTLAITSSLGATKRMNQKLYEERSSLILVAAKQFGEANVDRMVLGTCKHLEEPVSDASCYNVAISDLIDSKFLKAEDAIDPRDKTSMATTTIEIQHYYDRFYAVVRAGVNTLTGSILINGNAASTSTKNVTLTLSASGIDATEMCISNTSTCSMWQPYKTSLGWTLPANEGTKKVSVWFRSETGEQSPVVSDSIMYNPSTIDLTAIINGGADYVGTTNVTIAISTTDPASATAELCVSNTLTCTAWQAYTTSINWTLTSTPGVKSVYLWYRNDSGGFADAGDQIYYDATPPTGSFTINSDSQYTNNTNVTLRLLASDTESGIDQMCISDTNTCTAWEAYAVDKNWTLPGLDGSKTVYVWFRDKVRNTTTPYTKSIILDRVPPTNGTISINSNAQYTNAQAVSIALASTGADFMCISLSTSCTTWVPYAATASINLSATNGTQTVYVQYLDIAGNLSTRINDTIIFDNTKPTCINSGDSVTWTNANRTINYSCSDATSGCKVGSSGGSQVFSVTTQTASIAAYTIEDNAGNTTSCLTRTANVYVDKTVPVCTNGGDNSTWTNVNKTITFGCSDANSGCDVTASGGSQVFSTTTQTASIAAYTIKDNAGNTTNCVARTANVYVDKTGPTCTNSGDSTIWQQANRTINYGCSDANSGCDVTASGGSQVFSTTTQTASIAAYSIKDNAGNTTNCVARTANVYVDKTGPTCTNSGDSTTWQLANRVINYGCSDANSGCNPTYSGGSQTFSTTTQTANIAAYSIRDNNGNITNCPARVAQVYVDKTAPTCTNSGDSTSWTNVNRVISFGCSDANSGCNPTYSGGSQTFSTTTKTSGIPAYTIRDNVGNSANCVARTANVYVDKTAPTCTNSGDSTTWTSANRTIYFGCSDANSGCNPTATGGNRAFSTTTKTASIAAYTIKDNANNSTTCPIRTANVYIDKTAPTCTATKSNIGTTTGVTVTVTGNDANSGIVSGTGTFYNITSNKSYTVTDNSGNTGSCSVTVTPQTQYQSSTCKTFTTCQSTSCTWNSCLTGVNTCVGGYNSCRTPGCGVESYKYCQHSDCGWNACLTGSNTCAGGYTTCQSVACGHYISSSGLSSTCSASGSAANITYTTCSVNSYVCRCRCTSNSSSWNTTWWGSQPCNTSRCSATEPGTNPCPDNRFSATSTTTVNKYSRTVYTANTCTSSSCPWNSCLTGSNTCVGGWKTCNTSTNCPVLQYNYCQHTECNWNTCLTGSITCVGGYNSCPAEDCGCQEWNAWSGWSTTACTASGNSRKCQSRVVYI